MRPWPKLSVLAAVVLLVAGSARPTGYSPERVQLPVDGPPSPEFEVAIKGTVTDLVVDARGFVYVAGTTDDESFPTTEDAVDRSCNAGGRCMGQRDAFLMKLSPSGDVVYSTLLGGSRGEEDTRIAVAPDGSMWFAGTTYSNDFSGRSYMAECDGFAAYVGVIHPGRQVIDDFRCIGGREADRVMGLAMDAKGTKWLAGYTASADFPVRDAWQPVLAGSLDVFLVKFEPWSNDVAFSTFIGGSGLDAPNAIAIAPDGDAVITGATASLDFPLVRPIQSRMGGDAQYSSGDAFVTRVDDTGRFLEFSTYAGGTGPIYQCCGGMDHGNGIAVNRRGLAVFVGWTDSADFPVTAGTVDASCGSDGRCNSPLSDGFLAGLDDKGGLVFGSYLGGSRDDEAQQVFVLEDGTLLTLGETQSADFPSVNPWPSSFQPQSGVGVPYLVRTDEAASRYLRSTLIPFSSGRPSSLGPAAVDRSFVYVAARVVAQGPPVRIVDVVKKLRLD